MPERLRPVVVPALPPHVVRGLVELEVPTGRFFDRFDWTPRVLDETKLSAEDFLKALGP